MKRKTTWCAKSRTLGTMLERVMDRSWTSGSSMWRTRTKLKNMWEILELDHLGLSWKMRLIGRYDKMLKKHGNYEKWHPKPFQNSKGRDVRGSSSQMSLLCAPLLRGEIVLYSSLPDKCFKKCHIILFKLPLQPDAEFPFRLLLRHQQPVIHLHFKINVFCFPDLTLNKLEILGFWGKELHKNMSLTVWIKCSNPLLTF